MSMLNALALSVGILAGVATWLFLGPLAGALQIWVAFVAWGSFYHCGGKMTGLRTTIIGMLFGSLAGWVTLLVVMGVPMAASLGLPIWAGIVVAIAVAIVVLAANFEPLAAIPVAVYGFASLAGYALLSGKAALPGLTDASLANPLVVVWLSAIVGALFGFVSEMIATALAKPAPASAVTA